MNRAPKKTPLQELQDKRLLKQKTRLSILFAQAQKQWLLSASPAIALRQMQAVENMLLRHLGKKPP